MTVTSRIGELSAAAVGTGRSSPILRALQSATPPPTQSSLNPLQTKFNRNPSQESIEVAEITSSQGWFISLLQNSTTLNNSSEAKITMNAFNTHKTAPFTAIYRPY